MSIKRNLGTEQMIKRIANLRNQSNKLLFHEYNLQYLISVLDKQKIESIQKSYRLKQDGLNLLQFVRFFLNVIEHSQISTLYLTISLIEFFRQISRANGFCDKALFTHITNYICSKILQKRNSQNHIDTKYLPIHQTIKENYELKQYLLEPAVIYGCHDDFNYKLNQNKILIDKNKHDSVVVGCCFSPSLHKIFSLDCLSDSISIYDTSCNFIKKIRPKQSRVKKNIVLLSFAYSERQQRIGVVLKDTSLIFWENTDHFQYEKTISTATHCQQCQTNIYFLKHFNCWITTDRNGMIYQWDLQTQKPFREMQCKFRSKINDLTEIPCQNLLAIAQELKINRSQLNKKDNEGQPAIVLYDFLKGQAVAEIPIGHQKRIPHTIVYSQTYQVLLSAGFQKKIKVHQINAKYLDTTLRGQLLGHQSLITCFIHMQKTSIVISADDKGKVKLWDLSNFKCLQTIDFKDKTIITRLLGMLEVGKVGVLGSRINVVQFDDKPLILKKFKKQETIQPLHVACHYSSLQLLVLTKKDLRVIDLKNGLVKHIYCQLYENDEQITYFKYIQVLRKFVIGNQKGQLKIYCVKTGKLLQKLFPHSSSVSHIEYDQNNKLYITGSCDSNINIQKEQSSILQQNTNILTRSKDTKGLKQKVNNVQGYKGIEPELLRQIKNNFNKKQINNMAVSTFLGLIAVSSTQSSFYLWDYQFAKLIAQFTLEDINAQPTVLQFINAYSLLIIGTSNCKLYIIEIKRKQADLSISTLWTHNTKEHITHIYSDIVLKGSGKTVKPTSANIYVGLNKGNILVFDLIRLIEDKKCSQSVQERIGYNAQRQLKQNFQSQILKKKYKTHILKQQKNQINLPSRMIQAHQSPIICLIIIDLDQRYLVTSSTDNRIKIWKDYNQICDININLPLPYQWNLIISDSNRIKDKIMLGLKVIQSIFRKYGCYISATQAKFLKLQQLFQLVHCEDSFNLTQPHLLQSSIPRLFQTEFSLRDLHYEKIKKMNFKQIAGPTLKEIQMKKKLDQMQRQWQINKLNEQSEKQNLLANIQYRAHKNQEKDQAISFLQEPKKQKCEQKRNYTNNPSIIVLSQKIDNYLCKNNQNILKNPKNIKNKQKSPICFQQSVGFSSLKQSQKRMTQKFEDYYNEKQCVRTVDSSISRKILKSQQKIRGKPFRSILSQLNSRVKNSRQNKRFNNQSGDIQFDKIGQSKIKTDSHFIFASTKSSFKIKYQ